MISQYSFAKDNLCLRNLVTLYCGAMVLVDKRSETSIIHLDLLDVDVMDEPFSGKGIGWMIRLRVAINSLTAK